MPNHSLERTQAQREFMFMAKILRRSLACLRLCRQARTVATRRLAITRPSRTLLGE